jgi:hypothetical protein
MIVWEHAVQCAKQQLFTLCHHLYSILCKISALMRLCVCACVFVEFCCSCINGACLHVLRAIISFACFASAQCGSGRGVYHHREVGRTGLCCGTCPLVFVEMHCCIAHWQCRRGMIVLNAVLRPSRQYTILFAIYQFYIPVLRVHKSMLYRLYRVVFSLL